MTPVVIDASAGVELAADTVRGRSLRALLPPDAVPWVPDHFFTECGAVYRRWEINEVLTRDEVDTAVSHSWGVAFADSPGPRTLPGRLAT